ncbi:hypothetical protein [Bremerella volcania]|uniref:hypothetical protein n=1 Tax=Bremerella volcania TaxID=2527984 RepID=UPI00119DE52A|nr:hypothetical protein [Bremerella volcania]
MSEDPSSLEAGNPYQSPHNDADASEESKQPSTAKVEWLAKPLPLKWFWECLALGVLISVGPQYEEVLALFRGSLIALTTIVPVTLFGVMTGLGLALLVNCASREKFSQLQPGHWRLIVIMLTSVRFLLQVFVFDISPYDGQPISDTEYHKIEHLMYTPDAIYLLLATSLYVLVLRTTSETSIWKWYAGISAFVFFVTGTIRGLLATPFLDSYDSNGTVLSIDSSVFLIPGIVITYGPYAIGLLMVLGVIYDYAKNVERDFYHYLGIVLVAIQPGVQWWMDYLAYHIRFGPLN